MKHSMIVSTLFLGATKAFAPSAPLFRGTGPHTPEHLANSRFQPHLQRQVSPSYNTRGFMNMNFLSDMFYDLRSNSLGFASKDDIKAAALDPKAVFLDVRSQAEIDAASLKTDKRVIYATCTSTDQCLALEQLPKEKNTPIVVFCASGKRASSVKQVLESKGYTNVLNAGGLGDIDYL